MKEKFRLRCDLNTIEGIDDIDHTALMIEKYDAMKPYHRYHYLFQAYHELTHGKIDEEAFFTLGDILSDRPLFSHIPSVGLESVFLIEEDIAHSTLYIVEQSARSYYISKTQDQGKKMKDNLEKQQSAIIVI